MKEGKMRENGTLVPRDPEQRGNRYFEKLADEHKARMIRACAGKIVKVNNSRERRLLDVGETFLVLNTECTATNTSRSDSHGDLIRLGNVWKLVVVDVQETPIEEWIL